MTKLDETLFRKILDDVANEVLSPTGKGYQRHGLGTLLENQPWVKITENVGVGFLLGQALKKVFELSTKSTPESWRKEALGAIVYLVFALMWEDKQLIDFNEMKNSQLDALNKTIETIIPFSSGEYNDDDGN